MKLTNTKKAGRRWTLVFETEDEARNFNHFIQCCNHKLSQTASGDYTYCTRPEAVEQFGKELRKLASSYETHLPC